MRVGGGVHLCDICVFRRVDVVSILREVSCVICSLLMFVSDTSADHWLQTTQPTNKRWSGHSGLNKLLCKLCRYLPLLLFSF